MSMINEDLARRNKENYSFFGYTPNSATNEFNASIQEASEKIEKAKLRVSDEGKERLDKLLERYTINYANWINKSNSNGSKHVSVMISGASNYNMRKHEKFVERERKLYSEYEDIKDIDNKIWSIIQGDRIIKSDDENAIEKLQEKLLKAQEEHKSYKDYNIKARKEGKESLQAYVLQNSNGRIKAIKDRLERLIKMKSQETKEIAIDQSQSNSEESENIEINGVKIVDNVEAMRLQIVFDYKPDSAMRDKLKKNGFRWSPTNSAWQRFRGRHSIDLAKQILTV